MSETLKSAVQDHEAIHRRAVDRIVADLRPVRRLWPLSLRVAVWAALEAGVLLFVAYYWHRADLAQDLANPWYLLDIAAFILTGVVGATLALRAAIPGREPRPAETGFLVLLASASPLLLVHQPFNGTVPVSTFLDAGLPCALGTFLFAAVPWLVLLWAVKRGAPLSAGFDGALIGTAAFFSSFAIMRVNCPIDEVTHLLVWHFLPTLTGVALSAWAGSLLFRRRIKR
jgi:hypothetical protein